jgi:hypothetical protein
MGKLMKRTSAKIHYKKKKADKVQTFTVRTHKKFICVADFLVRRSLN